MTVWESHRRARCLWIENPILPLANCLHDIVLCFIQMHTCVGGDGILDISLFFGWDILFILFKIHVTVYVKYMSNTCHSSNWDGLSSKSLKMNILLKTAELYVWKIYIWIYEKLFIYIYIYVILSVIPGRQHIVLMVPGSQFFHWGIDFIKYWGRFVLKFITPCQHLE